MNTPRHEVQLKQCSGARARLDGMDLIGELDPSATWLPLVKEVCDSQDGDAFLRRQDLKQSSRILRACGLDKCGTRFQGEGVLQPQYPIVSPRQDDHETMLIKRKRRD